MAQADTAAVVAEIDTLLARAGLLPGHTLDFDYVRLPDDQVAALVTSWMTAVERLAGAGSQYASIARDVIKKIKKYGPGHAYSASQISGVLVALRSDYEAGYLRAVEELVHADLFADFLEMADELHKKQFKDPAAVLAGSVLEEHLRKLAEKSGLPTTAGGRPKKADTVNAELAKNGTYNKLEQKNVTAWLGLRNDAAHGKYDEYDATQVRLLIDNVRAFLARYPA